MPRLQPMRTSYKGRSMLRQLEGDELEAYQDSVGIWTIGTGHTAAAGAPAPRAGMTITQGESDAILSRDLIATEIGVLKALTRQPTQNQFDAMVSLAFNIGVNGFARSSVVSRFNRGDDAGAAAAFLMWNKAGGRVLLGLDKRRRVEMKLFNTGDRAVVMARIADIPAEEIEEAPAPGGVDVPRPDKTMVSSKTGWASIATAGSTVTVAASAASDALDRAQGVKDAADKAMTVFGIDWKAAAFIALSALVVGLCGFIWWDRRNRMYRDGV